MSILKNWPIQICVLICTAILLVSCNGGGGGGVGVERGSTGTLELSLLDSADSYNAVFVTINEVQVYNATNGWQTLSNLDLALPQQINLLDLVNGVEAYIGSAKLETGHYTRMSLFFDTSEGANYLLDSDDNQIFLTMPSGDATVITLVNGFDIEAFAATDLVLDFDVDESIVQADSGGNWLLEPTIRVVDTINNSLSGVVGNSEGDALDGVKISAQFYNTLVELADEMDRVVGEASTITDPGGYFIYLPPLSPSVEPYNIVATRAGYVPACQQLESNEIKAYEANFILDEITGDTGTFFARVEDLGEGEFVTIRIRQEHSECGMMEVASFNLTNTTENTELITLPTGIYQIVMSTGGWGTWNEEHTLLVDEENVIEVANSPCGGCWDY